MAKVSRLPKNPTPLDQQKHNLPTLHDKVANALADRKVAADAGIMLDVMIQQWGGVERLVADIYAEFQSAQKGGMTSNPCPKGPLPVSTPQ